MASKPRSTRNGGPKGMRFARITSVRAEKDSNEIEVIASTDAAVDMGFAREILVHSEDAVDLSAARSVLFNHDRDLVIGGIREMSIEGGKLRAKLNIHPEARTGAGVPILDLVRNESIEGISIGYDWRDEDVDFDRDTRTATVNKWRLREISITATQADVEAKITPARARAWERFTSNGDHPQEDTMGFEAWLKARGFDPKSLDDKQREALKKDFDAQMQRESEDEEQKQRQADLDKLSEAERAKAMEKERQEAEERAKRSEIKAHLYDLANARGVSLEGVKVDEVCQRFQDKSEVAGYLLERVAEQRKSKGIGAPVEITADVADKQRNAVVEAFGGRVRNEKVEANNPYAGRSLRSMGVRFARSMGIDTESWTKGDEANFFLGRAHLIPGMRAANHISGDFATFVTLEAVTKVVAKGYEAGAGGLVYSRLSDINRVPNFKASKIGALGTGNLQETAENAAFPELDKSEGVFSSTAKMWGGTLSLSFQTLVDDDTGQFERSLRNAGGIAQKTKEKRAIQKFLLGTSTDTATSTWTNNTSSGCTLVYTTADTVAAARQNIYNAAIGMMNKIGGDGNPLGTIPRFLLCGPTNSTYANGLLNTVGGQIVANSGNLELLVSPYLELSSLTGYSTTSYYLVADPMQTTGLLETVIDGYETPAVEPYDAGAVAAMNWKIWQPFEFDLFSIANSAGTTIIPAAQQATT